MPRNCKTYLQQQQQQQQLINNGNIYLPIQVFN